MGLTCETLVDALGLVGPCLFALDLAILSCRGSDDGTGGQEYDAERHNESSL